MLDKNIYAGTWAKSSGGGIIMHQRGCNCGILCYKVYVHVHVLAELGSIDSPNILVWVWEESSKDIDCQHSETTLRLDLHDGQNWLVEDGMTYILVGVSVSGNLKEGRG